MPVTLSSGTGATMRYEPLALSPSTKIEPSDWRANLARIGCAHLGGLERVPAGFILLGRFPFGQFGGELLVVIGQRGLSLGDAFQPFLLGARQAELGDFAVGFELGLQTGDAVLALDFALGDFRAKLLGVGVEIGDELGVLGVELRRTSSVAAATSSGLPGRLRKRRKRLFTTSPLSLTATTSLATAFSGSLMALPTVGPLTRAITGPSCRLLVRSHSQALSRAGRPRLPRKPSASSTPTSGSVAARCQARRRRTTMSRRSRDRSHRTALRPAADGRGRARS